jgi:Domain of unknown function (DUF1583_N)/Protein of unknown function (DUF1581)
MLAGDFEFHVEMWDGARRDTAVMTNGSRFTSKGAGLAVEVVSESGRDWVHFTTKSISAGKWNQHTLRYEGDTMTYLVNGIPIYKEPRHQGSPWIAIQTTGQRASSARNLRFAGEPKIAREVGLVPDETLRGWSGHYFSQSLPTAKLNQEVLEKDGQGSELYRSAPQADQLADLAWTVQNGELISGNAAVKGASARKGQSVIRYDRPLGEGETLSYEFFYEADKTLVHPAIGRTAYIFHPEGIRRHWMIETGGGWKLPQDNEVPLHADNPIKLPLKEADWNRVTLHLKNKQLQIRVNDLLVFDEEIEVLPQGTIFGLFHYADKTKARARNIKLGCPWPETLPEHLFGKVEEGT